MIRRPPRSTRTDTLFPYTTLFRSLPIVFPDQDLSQPEVSPLFDATRKMPPTLIATAGFDPLRDSERAYAAKLAEGGNRSEERRVGKEGVSTFRSRWSPSHKNKTEVRRTNTQNNTDR